MTDPNIGFVPYDGAIANHIFTIDPITGALVFPVDIETSTFQSLSASSFTTVVLPAPTPGKGSVQQILFTVSGKQFTLDYTNLQNTLNDNNTSINTSLGLYLLSSNAANTYQTIANMSNYLTTTCLLYTSPSPRDS